jgi:hypothetical protein
MEQSQLLTEKEVSGLLRIPLQTLRNNRSRGYGIPYLKLGRSVRYAQADIIEYVDSKRITPKERNL